jgi:hypothetical protein
MNIPIMGINMPNMGRKEKTMVSKAHRQTSYGRNPNSL